MQSQIEDFSQLKTFKTTAKVVWRAAERVIKYKGMQFALTPSLFDKITNKELPDGLKLAGNGNELVGDIL